MLPRSDVPITGQPTTHPNPTGPSLRQARRPWSAALLLGWTLALMTLSGTAPATEPTVPQPFPGYGLFYHDTPGPIMFATRWGYRDGWEDGRHDRTQGVIGDPQQTTNYLSPPEHERESVTRDKYARMYRAAYLHGYAHGSRL